MHHVDPISKVPGGFGMNIGMILNRRFSPDIRVEKEARTLINAGYRVHLLCRL